MDPEKYLSSYTKLEEWENQRRLGTARIPKDVIIESPNKFVFQNEQPGAYSIEAAPSARHSLDSGTPTGPACELVEQTTGIIRPTDATNAPPTPESQCSQDSVIADFEDEISRTDDELGGLMADDYGQEFIIEGIRGPVSEQVPDHQGCNLPQKRQLNENEQKQKPPRKKRAPNKVIEVQPAYPTMDQQESIKKGVALWNMLESLGPLAKNHVFEGKEEALFRMWVHCIIICKAYPYEYYNRKERQGFRCVTGCRFKITANETESNGRMIWKIKTITDHTCSLQERRPYPTTAKKLKVIRSWMSQLFMYANDNGGCRALSLKLGADFLKSCLSAKSTYAIPSMYEKNLESKVWPLYKLHNRGGHGVAQNLFEKTHNYAAFIMAADKENDVALVYEPENEPGRFASVGMSFDDTPSEHSGFSNNAIDPTFGECCEDESSEIDTDDDFDDHLEEGNNGDGDEATREDETINIEERQEDFTGGQFATDLDVSLISYRDSLITVSPASADDEATHSAFSEKSGIDRASLEESVNKIKNAKGLKGGTFKMLYVATHNMKQIARLSRPFIGIDGTFAKADSDGNYIILTCCGSTGNNNNILLGFAITDTESAETWELFLKLLKNTYRNTLFRQRIGIMSDGDKGIKKAVAAVLADHTHFTCSRRLYCNLKGAKVPTGADKKAFKREVSNWFHTAVVHPSKEVAFQMAEKLKAVFPANARSEAVKLVSSLDETSLKKWCAAYSDVPKFFLTTNNVCESYNKTLLKDREKVLINLILDISFSGSDYQISQQALGKKGVRFPNDDKTFLPVPSELLRCSYWLMPIYKVVAKGDHDKFEVLRPPFEECLKVLDKEHSIGAVKAKNLLLCSTIMGRVSDCRLNHAEYSTSGLSYVVDLKEKTCSCTFFQDFRLPCSHALAVIRKQNLPVSSFALPQYIAEFQREILAEFSDFKVKKGAYSSVVKELDTLFDDFATKAHVKQRENGRGRPRLNRRIESQHAGKKAHISK